MQNESSVIGGQYDFNTGTITNFYHGKLAELLIYDRAVPERELRSLAFLLGFRA